MAMYTVFRSEIINFIKIIKDIKGDKIDKGKQKYCGIYKNHYITILITVLSSRWLIKVI